VPGTVICKDVKDLTILGGNFTNCVAQPTWIVKGGNWSQVDFCSHLRLDLAERGLIPHCPLVCKHVVDEAGVHVSELAARPLERLLPDISAFRDAKALGASVRLDTATDADGVVSQKAFVVEYRYDHKVVK